MRQRRTASRSLYLGSVPRPTSLPVSLLGSVLGRCLCRCLGLCCVAACVAASTRLQATSPPAPPPVHGPSPASGAAAHGCGAVPRSALRAAGRTATRSLIACARPAPRCPAPHHSPAPRAPRPIEPWPTPACRRAASIRCPRCREALRRLTRRRALSVLSCASDTSKSRVLTGFGPARALRRRVATHVTHPAHAAAAEGGTPGGGAQVPWGQLRHQPQLRGGHVRAQRRRPQQARQARLGLRPGPAPACLARDLCAVTARPPSTSSPAPPPPQAQAAGTSTDVPERLERCRSGPGVAARRL